MGDEKNKPENGKIRLVAENDPSQIASNAAKDEAARALAKMVANLLRVIAGGGSQPQVMLDVHKALTTWLEFTKQSGRHYQAPGLDDLIIDRLFPDPHESRETEEEWRRWAEPNPFRDYRQTRRWIVRELRRSMLREIAATITGSDLQIRRNERDIEQSLDRFETALDKYRQESRRPQKPNPARQQMAENAIAKLRADKQQKEIEDREAKRDRMIANLQPHHLDGLRAAQSGDLPAFDKIDTFTMDVLGREGLLKRKPGRGRSKRDWELTDLGKLALSRHSPHSKSD